MRRASRAAITAVGVLASASSRADDRSRVDPAAARAGDANLASLEKRRGVTFSLAVGPSFTVVRRSMPSAAEPKRNLENGGALSLKLGHVATPRTMITFELRGSTHFHRVDMSTLERNTTSMLLAGAQYWAAPSLWLGFGIGAGLYQGHSVEVRPDVLGDITLPGPAAGVGIGVDLVRWRGAVIAIDAYSSLVIHRKGVLSTNGVSLGLAFD
ncbi:MAG: hypothetical protein AB7O24_23990 [Kofleriaceae bacterium]